MTGRPCSSAGSAAARAHRRWQGRRSRLLRPGRGWCCERRVRRIRRRGESAFHAAGWVCWPAPSRLCRPPAVAGGAFRAWGAPEAAGPSGAWVGAFAVLLGFCLPGVGVWRVEDRGQCVGDEGAEVGELVAMAGDQQAVAAGGEDGRVRSLMFLTLRLSPRLGSAPTALVGSCWTSRWGG